MENEMGSTIYGRDGLYKDNAGIKSLAGQYIDVIRYRSLCIYIYIYAGFTGK